LLKENHIEFREEELRNQFTSWLENPSVTNLLSKLECLLIGKPLQTGLILVGESHCILNNVMLSVAFFAVLSIFMMIVVFGIVFILSVVAPLWRNNAL
jgi:hypothetical protein